MKLFAIIRTLISYSFILMIILIFIIPLLLISLFPTKFKWVNKVFFFLIDKFYKLLICSLFVPIRIHGLENIPDNKHVIFAANHQSAIDGPALGLILNQAPHVWLILERYTKIPFIGFIIRKMFIPVKQDQSLYASKALLKAVKLAKNQFNIIIFPEGGRYIDGTIHGFFEGFAVIAKKAEMAVIPVFMPNNGKIYPPFSFVIHYYPLEIFIGPPITLRSDESITDFSLRVKEWFVKKSSV